MKILVTGAAGFVGSHLSERLKKEGHDVSGIDCFTDYYSPEFKRHTASILKKQGIEISEKNLATEDISEELKGVEAVYHLAAQPGNSAAISFETFTLNNLRATKELLEACRGSDSLKSFINIATSSVYGLYATSPETAPAEPVSNYGVTKLAAEQLVMSWNRNFGFPACSLRLFSVYGERERPDKLFPKLVKAIAYNEEFPLYEGSAEHKRSFTYVQDIVKGFMAALDNWDKAEGEIFNIGCDTQTTTGAVMEIVEKLMGQEAKKKILPPRSGDQLATHADISKAKKLLGYQPDTQPEEGLTRFVDWFQNEIFNKVKY